MIDKMNIKPNELHSGQSRQKKRHTFRLIGLRGKLLLATLLLFILPLAGFSYLKELELFLKQNHSESVLDAAKILASAFQDNASLISLNRLTQSANTPIYCHSTRSKKSIDGFSDDWHELQPRQQFFTTSSKDQTNPAQQKLSLLCANDSHYYYFLITASTAVAKQPDTLGVVNYQTDKAYDSILFQHLNYYHQVEEYRFNMQSPGWVDGLSDKPHSYGSENHIRGEWQPNKYGFSFEFKVPASQINQYLAFKLQHTAAGNNRKIVIASATAPAEPVNFYEQLNPLLLADPLTNLRLAKLVPDNTRLWLLNKHQYVSAQASKHPVSKNTDNRFSLLTLYRRLYLLLMDYPEQRSLYSNHQEKIDSPAIQATLQGNTSIEWLDTPHSEQLILSITAPVYDNDKNVIGSLILEQTNDTLLTLQDSTFEQLMVLTIILFCAVTLTLLFFSTRLLKRIIKLRDDTNRALSNDGRISNQLYRHDNDEIGDLARSFSGLLARIDQNNDYLRTLSGKLSHELRTPLTIIKSSLENLEITANADEKQKYIERAHEGCVRLNNLLNRMSEASRLEQSIDSMDKEAVDMVSFLSSYMDTIQAAHESLEFIFYTPLNSFTMVISPELMAQLLDKLISNAISFHKKNTPIKLTMVEKNGSLIIELNNHGELIEKNKLDSIFSSLTSYRSKKAQSTHLGIGLYIARLISEFHNGRLKAVNNEHNQSVSFILTLTINHSK